MRLGAIGDVHAPYTHPMYLDFCRDTFELLRCDKIHCVGDMTDNHAISYHEKDPNLKAHADELKLARRVLAPWHKTFRGLTITIGNHDDLPARQLQTAGICTEYLKAPNTVYKTPTWQWDWEFEFDGVLWIHGTGFSGKDAAYNCAVERRQSVGMGHLHTNFGYKFHTNATSRIFGLSVGCGIDTKALAFAYGKFQVKRPILGCAGVIDGEQPISIVMPCGRGEKYHRSKAGKKPRRKVLV